MNGTTQLCVDEDSILALSAPQVLSTCEHLLELPGDPQPDAGGLTPG